MKKYIATDDIKADKKSQDMRYETPVALSEKVQKLDKILKEKQSDREMVTSFQQASSLDKLTMEPPNDYRMWIHKGLALESQMLYVDAVNTYSDGLVYNTFCDTLYECRGHIYITLGRYHEAVADSNMCVRLNPLNWYGWYHKGLGYYFMGEYEKAVTAFAGCFEHSYDDNVHRLAAMDWTYVCLRHLQEKDRAEELIRNIKETTPGDALDLYKTKLLIYKGVKTLDEVLNSIPKDDNYSLQYVSLGYASAMKQYFDGDRQKAKEQLIKVVEEDEYWQAFGYLASRAELKRQFDIDM